jgi:hypothetical protein
MPTYKVNKGLVIQKLDDKTVIFDGEKSALYTLNETASVIFQKLKIKWPVEKIVAYLVKEYSVKDASAQKDVETLISDLTKKKILSVKKS